MRVVLKLFFLSIWLPLMMLVATLPWLLKWEGARRFCSCLAFKGVNALFGIRVHLHGSLSPKRPLMLVSNHSSYVDIFVLGSRLPIAFTPKKEIASWPIIGYCCKLAGCVFVERTPKAIAQTKQMLAQKLAMGRVMCIFAEGTTNNGSELKPFKSSFFGLAEGGDVLVQPVAVAYMRPDGEPLDAQGRAQIAWYDDMSLLPHLMQLLKMKRIDAHIHLLEPLAPTGDRKALCGQSEAVIKQALEQMI